MSPRWWLSVALALAGCTSHALLVFPDAGRAVDSTVGPAADASGDSPAEPVDAGLPPVEVASIDVALPADGRPCGHAGEACCQWDGGRFCGSDDLACQPSDQGRETCQACGEEGQACCGPSATICRPPWHCSMTTGIVNRCRP